MCRPSCNSRTPNSSRVSIHPHVAAAIKAGCRPCTRCKQDRKDGERYKEEVSKEMIDYLHAHYKSKFSLKEVREALQKTPSYIHRSFKAVNGSTSLTYLHTLRVEEIKKLLKHR